MLIRLVLILIFIFQSGCGVYETVDQRKFDEAAANRRDTIILETSQCFVTETIESNLLDNQKMYILKDGGYLICSQ